MRVPGQTPLLFSLRRNLLQHAPWRRFPGGLPRRERAEVLNAEFAEVGCVGRLSWQRGSTSAGSRLSRRGHAGAALCVPTKKGCN